MDPSPCREPGRVREMFEAIAHRYDLLNRLLSLRRDVGWRKTAALSLPTSSGARVLDLCCGTGDLAIAVSRAGRAGTVICCDFAHPMLTRAASKIRRARLEASCWLVEGDGLALPFGSGAFDAVTVAFGVRNFVDRTAGFREILRVLKPGGTLAILEFSEPTAPLLARLYRFYLMKLLPRIGDAAAGRRGPYGYLAGTIAGFPDPASLAGSLRESGFAAAGWTPLSGGIVCLHTAIKGIAL